MKLKTFLAEFFIHILCLTIFTLGIHSIDLNNKPGLFFSILWFIISVIIAPNLITIQLSKKYNKELEEIKRLERIKGAKSFLEQVSSTERFREVTNQSLPIIKANGEKIGTTTVYSDLSDFLEKNFKC